MMSLKNNADLNIRAKNLMWTVSGNHELKASVNQDELGNSKSRYLYEAIKLGAADKYCNMSDVMLYSLKKQFLGGDANLVNSIISLCIDCAVYDRVSSERAGASELRADAYNEMIEDSFAYMANSHIGRLEYAVIADALQLNIPLTKQVSSCFQILNSVKNGGSDEIITAADEIYNSYLDSDFGKKNITLEQVLAVTVREMIDEGFIKDTDIGNYINEMLCNASQGQDDELDDKDSVSSVPQEIDDESVQKLSEYIEQIFGKSVLLQAEQQRMQKSLCTDTHRGRKIHISQGLLYDENTNNVHYKLAEKHRQHNEEAYYSDHRIVKHNLHSLADLLKRCLLRRTESEYETSDRGTIVPSRLWRVGRSDTTRLFVRKFDAESIDFVVDVLVDGSGSQSKRQGAVASQAYIISSALSLSGIPHRVMSYCTVFDYTVLHRFRNYDEGGEADKRIFDYSAKASNRDGLAIRAALYDLSKRKEQHKILIILSDGKPNDVSIKKNVAGMSNPYTGSFAIYDTAMEIRKARGLGISVLGVFAGLEADLDTERKIFGKDFAYIRTLANFSQIVGKYLQKNIEEM
ncbi:MAG: nitric oxide reductase activation protein [Oscillospiraceae bacterium]